MDDKHRVKVGEPHYPVAAAERGKKVLVSRGTSFEVADHDFTKFSLVPSVSLVVDIPTCNRFMVFRSGAHWIKGRCI